MSLLPLKTHITAAQPASLPYFASTGGGGGGGVSTVTSTLAVENITTLPGNDGIFIDAENVSINGALFLSTLTTANASGLVDVVGGLSFTLGGGLVGVSTINGAGVRSPTSAFVGPIQVATAPGATTDVYSFSTTVGHLYQLGGKAQLSVQGGGTFAATDSDTLLLLDGATGYDLAEYPTSLLSTFQSVAGLNFPLNLSWIAQSAGAAIQVTNSHTAGGLSTVASIGRVVVTDFGSA